MAISKDMKKKDGQQSTETLRPSPNSARYQVRLFVAGQEPNSKIARENLKAICDRDLEGGCRVRTIDVFEDFTEAMEEHILVTPALVVDRPVKVKIFGNLSDRDKVLAVIGGRH